MICIIADSFLEAKRYAESHLLEPEEWFFGADVDDIKRRNNFHVLVAGIVKMHPSYFEKVFSLAKMRGQMK